ncbi:MAG: DUF1570 domain-containing protein [Pirellulales bacterium]|nr:DUF1570 domain-containing protein [Pirellulales bacterium]
MSDLAKLFSTIARIATVFSVSSVCALLLSASTAIAGSKSFEGMIEVTVDDREFEGRPLAWDEEVVHLLGRDGRFLSFDPKKVKEFRQTGQQFRPYSTSKIRSMLLRELGSGFEVTGTSHYMVAHRKGQRDKWAERFEDLYRSFVRYFSVRGFKLEEPSFPLIAVVCRNQNEFMRLTAEQGVPVGRGILGFYSLKSNRITLFDRGENGSMSHGWQTTGSTIIHEATHQLAFNTGINSRYSPPPLWVAEGLATLFEAPGVYDSSAYRSRDDRINRVRFTDFKKIPRTKNGELPIALVASDGLFHSRPDISYAESWAMTFYLVETQPRRFMKYLKKTVGHRPFTKCASKQRIKDFTSVFGTDWRMFDAQFMRYMNELE